MTMASLLDRVRAAGLRPLRLAGRDLLPIVQGGMGVGVSAHRLAGSVAGQGAWGTIASVDLRRHHPDLMARSESMRDGDEKKAVIEQANQEALAREIGAARRLCEGRGLLAVNVMRAVSDYASSVRTALESGIDALVVGAGLPLDLPELAQDHPRTALVPILSEARGVTLLWKKWERRQRLPAGAVGGDPRPAGGRSCGRRGGPGAAGGRPWSSSIPAMRAGTSARRGSRMSATAVSISRPCCPRSGASCAMRAPRARCR